MANGGDKKQVWEIRKMRGKLLCGFCSSVHWGKRAKTPQECFVCKGVCERLDALVKDALEKAKGFEWETFAVSSSLPREALAREEDLWDWCQPQKCMCIKNALNRDAAAAIAKKSGNRMDAKNPQALFSIDFLKGKGDAMPAPMYLFGHYTKHARDIAQSRWECSKCKGRGCDRCAGSGKMYSSVEDEMRAAAKETFLAKDALLHASGREDVDVRMLGEGRPFVLEVQEPKKKGGIGEFEKSVNKGGKVGVHGVRSAQKSAIELVCTSHFEKEYDAHVEMQRQPTQEDVGKIKEMFAGKFVLLAQQTPMRVLHRRSDLERKRKVFLLDVKVEGQFIRLKIRTDAGTYVKEFVSSDGGRTVPSIAGVLGCAAVCRQLDVINICDEFLNTAI
ncbi:tRNA pseudouridine(54/55) synthase Pus10 [Candidatus Micrarchaeota archaeon]|nr:tRNA pseudouridine(54/55) synthase Pus10 [Candidatus Micrarchaeota archaeon]